MTTLRHTVIRKTFENILRTTPYDFSGLSGYNSSSTTFKHIENFLQKRVLKPNKSAKQILISERGEAFVLCQEAIINEASLCVQGITGDAIFNCDYVFTLVFCILHSKWSFVVPKSRWEEWVGSRMRKLWLNMVLFTNVENRNRHRRLRTLKWFRTIKRLPR